MHYICTREEMQEIDHYSIQNLGIPGIVLMEKAAMALEEEICSRFGPDHSVLILTEKGNNGGDGLALGRLLLARGFMVTIFEIGRVNAMSDSYRIQRDILTNLGVKIRNSLPEENFDLWIDAVFGVGLKREVSGIHKKIIEKVNQKSGYKIAVDVPSGVDADNGHILGCCFKADLTVTFGLMKVGLLLFPGAAACGTVAVKDIGFPKAAVEHVLPSSVGFDPEDLRMLPQRMPWSNKGTYGRVLLVAGSKNMAGAAYLSALAAYRSGSGLVRIFTCEANREILQTLLPEAIMTTWSTVQEAEELLTDSLSWANVIGIGPGIGQGVEGRTLLMTILREAKVPLVIDADAINILAGLYNGKEHPGWQCRKLFESYPFGIILTPHLKEMERLVGHTVSEIRSNLIPTAEEHADEKHVYVLKDARTIVSDGSKPAYINQSGNHGMSVGGSGDVLTGILCGFLAGGLPLITAARLGVYCHGLAGDRAAAAKGYYGLKAADIAEYLCEVIH